MKMPEGKYVLVKDPNKVCSSVPTSRFQLPLPKRGIISLACRYSLCLSIFTDWGPVDVQPVIRLYAVPMTAFTTEEDEDGEGYEGEEHEFTS
jgi:hypothetical protein